MANSQQTSAYDIERDVVAGTTIDGDGPTANVKPKALGMDASMLVALAMIIVILLAIWKKVPAMVAGALDKQIAGIKEQLEKANQLREEAEAIKAEYQSKARQAIRDAEAIRANADEEAKLIVSKARADATNLIGRRKAMAEQKIAAAEAEAVADVRAKAAATAAAAAEMLIADRVDASVDASLIDETISALN